MFCTQCGASNTEGSEFCLGCGAKLEISDSGKMDDRIPPAEEIPHEIHEKSGKGKKKVGALVVIIAVFVVVAGGALAIFVLNITNPVHKFEHAIQNGDFVQACELYRQEIQTLDSGKVIKAIDFLKKHAQDVRTQYLNATLDYEDALNQLQEMDKLGALGSDEIASLIAEINEMRISRVAYENAQMAIGADDYQTAIGELHKVIKADSDYTNAQTQLAAAIKNYKEQILTAVSAYDTDKRYDDAIADLRGALLIVLDDADFLAKIDDYNKKIDDDIKLLVDETVRKAKSLVSAEGDYETALSDLRTVAVLYPNSEVLQSAIADMGKEYVAKEVAEAQNLVADIGDYMTAIDRLRSL